MNSATTTPILIRKKVIIMMPWEKERVRIAAEAGDRSALRLWAVLVNLNHRLGLFLPGSTWN